VFLSSVEGIVERFAMPDDMAGRTGEKLSERLGLF
jgi:hypothetical protein